MRRLVREERGVALVLAIISILVLSGLSAAALYSVTVNQRVGANDAQGNQAFALAEDGLAYAEARLYIAVDPSNDSDIPSTTFSQSAGTVSYSGTISPDPCNISTEACTWTLVGSGTVNGITRTVSAQSAVPQDQFSTSIHTSTWTTTSTTSTTATQVSTVAEPGIWSYIYLGNVPSCLQGNITINVPLYTPGALCMSGHASYTGADLEVGGSLSLSGAASIGSKKQPISKLDVGGSCSPAPCDGNTSPIWVSPPGVGHTVPPIPMPIVDWNAAYATVSTEASSATGCPAGFFATGASDPATTNINLFPSGTSYDCKVGANELKWDGTSNLTITGVFYFDGSLAMSGNTHILYSGKGTIYLMGVVSMAGNAQICGIANCTANWNPSQNAIVLVAGCWSNASGSTLVSSNCVNLQGTTVLQTGTYAATDYEAAGTVTNMGPVVAATGGMAGNIGQLLPLQSLPPGTPDSYTVTLTTTVSTSSTSTSTSTSTQTTTTPQQAQSPSSFSG